MWLHRIGGMILAMVGIAMAVVLGLTLYSHSERGLHTVVQIGIPGVLIISLAAGFTTVMGVTIALAPGSPIRRTSRAHRA